MSENPRDPSHDGVGCESCHGASDRWIGEHTGFDWARRADDEKELLGMIPTRDLVRRARACAQCHVGAPAGNGLPAREVNHDLIAAGHPRLSFEFSAYLANMPHHWREDVGPDSAPDFAARSWVVGQAVSAKASHSRFVVHQRKASAAPRTLVFGTRRQSGQSFRSSTASRATTTYETTRGVANEQRLGLRSAGHV